MPYVLITDYSAVQLNEPVLRAAPRIDKPVRCRVLERAIARAVDDGKPGVWLAHCSRENSVVYGNHQQLNAARRLSVNCFGSRFSRHIYWIKPFASVHSEPALL